MPRRIPMPIRDRFPISVYVDTNGCWIWTNRKNQNGYGVITVKIEGRYRVKLAHRVAYAAFRGPIPSGFVLDHLCRVRGCCNPDHLEAVTAYENNLRGNSPSAKAAAATHCSKGHPFSGSNVYFRRNGTGRVCKTCRRDRQKRWYASNNETLRVDPAAQALIANENF